jgi:hypothetical protein
MVGPRRSFAVPNASTTRTGLTRRRGRCGGVDRSCEGILPTFPYFDSGPDVAINLGARNTARGTPGGEHGEERALSQLRWLASGRCTRGLCQGVLPYGTASYSESQRLRLSRGEDCRAQLWNRQRTRAVDSRQTLSPG